MNFEALIDALKLDEGLALKPYMDTAVPPRITIGHGRNLSDKGISHQEAHDMLVRDAIQAQRDAADLVPNWLMLSDVRQNVLSNMAFNLGKSRLMQFHDFLAAVNSSRFDDAAIEMLDSKWAEQVGHRATRLAQEMHSGTV